MHEPGGARSTAERSWGPWAWLTLLAVCALGLYTDTSRFEGPIGEKYLPTVIQPGGADFVAAFNGACALLRGANPYDHHLQDLADPLDREQVVPGRRYNVLYLPTHVAMYVPLALATDCARRKAAHVWFGLNLVWLVALSAVSAKLLALVTGNRFDPLLALLLLFVLAASPAVQLLLERGQSDLFTSLLVWSAVLLALRGRFFAATFLMSWGLLIKGYPLLLAAGFLPLALRRSWRATSAGATVAFVLLLAPVVQYLPIAIAAGRARGYVYFMNTWYNHSFRNLAYFLRPEWAERGGLLLSSLGALGALLCWVNLWRTPATGPTPAGAGPRAAVHVHAGWLVLFATAALAAMVSVSSVSHTYNLVLVLPGLLVAAIGQRQMPLPLVASKNSWLIGLWLLSALATLYLPRLGHDRFPLAAVGLLLTLGVCGAAGLVGLLRGGRTPLGGAATVMTRADG